MLQDLSLILPLPIIRILGLGCTQIGLFAYSENQQLRISSEKISALVEHYDILVALEANDISENQHLVKPEGVILYNENTIPSLRAYKWFDPRRKYIPIAFDSFAKLWGPPTSLSPFVALGTLAAFIDLEIESLFHYLPSSGTLNKSAYQDCIIAGSGYIHSIDQKSEQTLKPVAYDSSRIFISGFDALCLAARKVDTTALALPHDTQNALYQNLKDSCTHYNISIREGTPLTIGPWHVYTALQAAYSKHVLIVHHHDEAVLFAATQTENTYLVSDLAALYSHIYLAMLKQQVERVGTTIFVAEQVLMGYETLAELPIPSEHLYDPYQSFGSERARLGLISTGSNKGVILEAQQLLKTSDLSTRYIHLNYQRGLANWLDSNVKKCDSLITITPLSETNIPILSIPHQEINEWHDAKHLSQKIQAIVTPKDTD